MHTPGPWHVGAEKSFVFLPGIVKPIACGSQANARLIAAAPDMLTALREIDFLVDGREDITDDGGPNVFMSIGVLVRAAIAKAEGK